MRAIPLTSPERTLLDLGAVAPRRVEAAMEDALLRGLVTLGSLRRLLERVGEHGRDGSGVLRSLVAERHPGAAPTESRLEDAILRILRAHGLPEPVRQHPVALPAGREARIDLAYPDVKVGIEADGRIWHSGREDFARDRARANQLAGLGWTLLRYGWHDVRGGDGLAAEVANVRRAIGGRRAG
jgi:very-short-patch-repair endonuclease